MKSEEKFPIGTKTSTIKIAMEYLYIGIRLFAGIGLIFFGLNKIFNWAVPPYKGEGLQLITTLQTVGKGYLWKLVIAIELLAGLSFVTNQWVPFFAIALFPVMLNAYLFHLFMDRSKGMIGAVIFYAMNLFVLIYNGEHYHGIF